jgi:MSHA pilin protein MshA
MKQQGFTLIELVVVIVLLGILAAVALPKMIDLSGEAEKASVKAIAGAIASAGEMNYARSKTNSTLGVSISDATDACAGAASSVLAGQSVMLEGAMTLVTALSSDNHEYQISGGAPKACAVGVAVQCIVTSHTLASAVAYVPCTN